MNGRFAAAALTLPLVFSGCARLEQDAQRREELRQAAQVTLIDSLRQKGIQVEKINLPPEILDLETGNYEITVPTSKGQHECIASVIKTTHGYKNLMLDCK